MKKLLMIALSLVSLSGLAVAQTAGVQVIHNSPDPLASSVDIYLGSDLAISSFGYLEATGILDLPAGTEIVIGVAPGGSAGPEDILATFPVTLSEGETYLVMATGVLDASLPANPEGISTAFTLEISSPIETMAAAGETELLVYHGSPSAPTVDVQVMSGPILVDDLAYREFFGYFTAPATDLVLEVTLGNDNTAVVKSYDAPLSALDGAGAVVFAAGYLGDDASIPAFGLYVALTDGTVLPLSEATVATESVNWSGVKALFE